MPTCERSATEVEKYVVESPAGKGEADFCREHGEFLLRFVLEHPTKGRRGKTLRVYESVDDIPRKAARARGKRP